MSVKDGIHENYRWERKALHTLGFRLTKVLARFGWSQADLARIMGVSPPAAGNYLKGKQQPRAKALAPLGMRGIDINWLLTGQGEMMIAGRPPVVVVDPPDVVADVKSKCPACGYVIEARLETGGRNGDAT